MKRVKRQPGMPLADVLALYSERSASGCLLWTRPAKDTGSVETTARGSAAPVE